MSTRAGALTEGSNDFGSGSPEGAYAISSVADLKEFSDKVNSGQRNINGYLTTDIDLTNVALDDSGSNFTAIGTESSSFKGKFDGCGKKIIGLTINKSTMDFQGLFSRVDNDGLVQNVWLVDGSITGDYYVGGVVGGNYGTVQNCYNTGAVSGESDVGGVVGWNFGTVQNCFNTGAVSGSWVGGVVGDNDTDSKITDCYNTGAVSGTSYIGGVVGILRGDGGEITKCYNAGAVNGVGQSGGVVGECESGTITDCYYNSDTSGVTKGVGNGSGTANALTTDKMIGAAAATNMPNLDFTSTWVTKDDYVTDTDKYCYYPQLKVFANKGIDSYERYGKTDYGWRQYKKISTVKGLRAMRDDPYGYYTLAADIDFTAGYDYVAGEDNFTAIGTEYDMFNGKFDGNGHKIIGLTINKPNTDCQGLFGSVGNIGLIQNVGLVDGSIKGNINVGGVVGHNYGTVQNCYNTGAVSGGTDVGGVVGKVSNGTITNCYYNSETSGVAKGSGSGTATPLATVQMTADNLGAFTNFDSNIWGVRTNGAVAEDTDGDDFTTQTAYYPYLKVFGVASAQSTELNVHNFNGTWAGYIEISDVEELQAINDNLSGNYVLTEDIDFTGIALDASGSNFTAIGYDDGYGNGEYFTGKFDGCGHVITGLTINKPSVDYQGLFGHVDGGLVQNVGLEGGNITGKYSVGGVVGYNFDSTVQNCYNTSAVSGVRIVGGIVGFNHSNKIQNCYNTGSISGSTAVGGVAGNNSDSGTVQYCYNAGFISGTSNYGGFVGSGSGAVINCYYNSETSGVGVDIGTGTATALTTAQMTGDCSGITSGFAFNDTDGALWVTKDDDEAVGNEQIVYYPQLKVFADMGVDNVSGTLHNFNGTWAGYIEISDVAELRTIADNLEGNYVLTENITFGDSDWIDGDAHENNFTAIGYYNDNYDNKTFTGKFDGNGHVITGLTINKPDTHHQGLFGYVGSNGLVQNVGLEGGSIKGGTLTGGVVGNNGGTVQGCYSTSTVSGSNDVGGIVGYSSGTINNCYHIGAVSGETHIGGIAGHGSGNVQNCYNIGKVSATSAEPYVGGIVGLTSNGSITNCFYNKDICTVGGINSEDTNGAKGLTTEKMTWSTLFGTSTDWVYTENVKAPNILSESKTDHKAKAYYPQLKVFEDTTAPSSTVVFSYSINPETSVTYGAEYNFEFTLNISVDGGAAISSESENAIIAFVAGNKPLAGDNIYDLDNKERNSFVYDTNTKLISGENAVDVSIIGIMLSQNVNISDFFTLTVEPIALTDCTMTATKVYDKTGVFEDVKGKFSASNSGIINDDVVTATADLTAPSASVNTYDIATIANLALDGADKYFYTLASNAIAANLTITAAPASRLTIAEIPDQAVTGSAIEPTLTVMDGTTTLVLNTDYTVSYSNNVNKGTATATVTCMGNYSGTLSADFNIVGNGNGGGGGSIGGGEADDKDVMTTDGIIGWDAIYNALAKLKGGDTVTILMNGETFVPAKIVEVIKSKNITLTFMTDDNESFGINGSDVSGEIAAYAEINISTDNTAAAAAARKAKYGNTTAVCIKLKGFGFYQTILMSTSKSNAGKTATLVKYNAETAKYEYVSHAAAGTDGSVKLTVGGSGIYAVLLSNGVLIDGDATGDGVINVLDAKAVLQYVVGLLEFNEEQKINIDFNGIGITIKNALAVMRMALGLVDKLG